MTAGLPDALTDEDLRRYLVAQPVALFLDYDGTLTPIVARPELAILDDAMRDELKHIAGQCFVAILSGRDLADVRAMVLGAAATTPTTNGDGLWFAGSHGFEAVRRTEVQLGTIHRERG